jgi:hypothetical protein
MNNKDFEPIRIRIMQEAYELADRGDAEGYNSVKVMCNDVQNLLRREWVGLTESERNDVVWSNTRADDLKEAYDVALAIEQALRNKNT